MRFPLLLLSKRSKEPELDERSLSHHDSIDPSLLILLLALQRVKMSGSPVTGTQALSLQRFGPFHCAGPAGSSPHQQAFCGLVRPSKIGPSLVNHGKSLGPFVHLTCCDLIATRCFVVPPTNAGALQPLPLINLLKRATLLERLASVPKSARERWNRRFPPCADGPRVTLP